MKENPDQSIATFSGAKPSTKQAWAILVRRRWPENCVNHVAAEWDLTDAKARGLVFGEASQNTIDEILNHPRGGFALGLTILEIRMQTRLRAWVQQQQGELEIEAQQRRAEADQLAQMARRLPDVGGAVLGLDGPGLAGLGLGSGPQGVAG